MMFGHSGNVGLAFDIFKSFPKPCVLFHSFPPKIEPHTNASIQNLKDPEFPMVMRLYNLYTLPETNIVPENRSSQKETRKYSNHPFSGAKMLVSRSVHLTAGVPTHSLHPQKVTCLPEKKIHPRRRNPHKAATNSFTPTSKRAKIMKSSVNWRQGQIPKLGVYPFTRLPVY